MVTPLLSNLLAGLIHVFSGRFLHSMLSDLERWRTDEQTYLLDNRGRGPAGGKDQVHPGFRKTLSSPSPLNWKELKSVAQKWHKALREVHVFGLPSVHTAS